LSWRTFVDVGANIGTHTIWALRNGFENAICIEADVENFKLLRVNQILNGVEKNCSNVLAAVSHENGTSLLELSPSNFGDHRLRLSREHVRRDAYDESQRQIQEITTRRLDTIVESIGVNRAGFSGGRFV
jgi:FkbM family methyltransferase